MRWSEFSSTLEYWGHRLVSDGMLILMDDPAWLAFMFC
jgi:hypothetical protein